MSGKDILFVACIGGFIIFWISFKYYEKKYQSNSDEEK